MATTAIILAGGRGDRLGGQDKGWVPYQGAPLITRVIERLQPQVDAFVISCNRNQARYEELGYPVIADTMPDYQGPLAGIAAAAALCHGEHVLLSPCDTPLLPRDLVSRLLKALASSGAEAAIPVDAHGAQFLNCLLQRHVISSALGSLQAKRPAVKSWLSRLDCVNVDFTDQLTAFHNINAPHDLAAGPD